MTAPIHVLITGASSGIGEALAHLYAAPGTTLSLSGRDADRVDAVARACRDKGATVDACVMDVTDQSAMESWVLARDDAAPIDLVIANAGVSGGTAGIEGGTAASRGRHIFDVNLGGVLNTVLPVITRMRARRRGQIALMSSLASFRGIGGAPAYSASKAAVRVWGEGVRPMLAQDGIGLSVICPGFVVSRMTAVNRFPMPFLMDTPRAARIIKKGLAANRGRIAFPWPMMLVMWLIAALPDRIAGALTARLPAKE